MSTPEAGVGVAASEGRENIDLAACRVDYRLTYARTDEPRSCHDSGIDGGEIPNAYYGREGYDGFATGSGAWDDPEHPDSDAPEEVHIARWFETALREAIHEAMEWFWVDGKIYLDPHGEHENAIHDLSGEFARKALALALANPPTHDDAAGVGREADE